MSSYWVVYVSLSQHAYDLNYYSWLFFGDILLCYFAEPSKVHLSSFSILTIERCHHRKRMSWYFAVCLACVGYEQVWWCLLICLISVHHIISNFHIHWFIYFCGGTAGWCCKLLTHERGKFSLIRNRCNTYSWKTLCWTWFNFVACTPS
jgi:hypothetical protein